MLGNSETISLNKIPEWHGKVRPEMFGKHSLQCNFLFCSLSLSPLENKEYLRITTYVLRRYKWKQRKNVALKNSFFDWAWCSLVIILVLGMLSQKFLPGFHIS